MTPSEDQIIAALKLLERMANQDDHTHAKEHEYPVYEVGAGLVRRVPML